jgi:hypothetical protein
MRRLKTKIDFYMILTEVKRICQTSNEKETNEMLQQEQEDIAQLKAFRDRRNNDG